VAESDAFRAPLPFWEEGDGPRGVSLKLTPDNHVLIEVGHAGIVLAPEDAREMALEMTALARTALHRKQGN